MADRLRRMQYAVAQGVQNVENISEAADDVGLSFVVALALIDKESRGANIYGHDKGGALSTNGRTVTVSGETYPPGSDIPVTPQNFAVFLMLIAQGVTSNGVGPAQITYAGDLPDGRVGGYFRQAADDENLDLANPEHNIRFGLSRFAAHLAHEGSIALAGTAYNAGSARNGVNDYGLDLAARVVRWRQEFRCAGI